MVVEKQLFEVGAYRPYPLEFCLLDLMKSEVYKEKKKTQETNWLLAL